MTYNKEKAQVIADLLLQIKALELNYKNPFKWASGILSPIYCDNRRILSFPKVREHIAKDFTELINQQFKIGQVIAGVATGGIAHGVLVADRLKLPFIYVRAQAKTHGKKNQIEGEYKKGQKVVLVEDLVSTGMSSMKAIKILRESGMEVIGLVSIFSYNFKSAINLFKEHEVSFYTLSSYPALLEVAQSRKYITKNKNNY